MSKKPLFQIGQLMMTQGVAALDLEVGALKQLVQRHATGDFGTVCAEDRQENLYSVNNDLRVISAYEIEGTRIWIITEADRTSTTILFPEEY